jgi:hypothetical protein
LRLPEKLAPRVIVPEASKRSAKEIHDLEEELRNLRSSASFGDVIDPMSVYEALPDFYIERSARNADIKSETDVERVCDNDLLQQVAVCLWEVIKRYE